jgi:hypothetical protein
LKPSRFKTLLTGLIAGVTYAFFVTLIVTSSRDNVSIGYIFILPLILGAIPVLFSTKEQLELYTSYILLPWGIVMTFSFLCTISGLEGMLCLVMMIGPFLLLGTLGTFIFRLIKLRSKGKGTKLYFSLFIPFLFLVIEHTFQAEDQFHTIKTNIEINADKSVVWKNIKNVKDIKSSEISTHFIHIIGIPKPLNGQLSNDGIGGVRKITWEKGIRFEEKITAWVEGKSFSYDINVDPKSIPPNLVTLSCTYRLTTSLNWYGKLWADFILKDFNEMILEIVKKRSEERKSLQVHS